MAIISHYRKYVFIHVPRTGGHSAYAMLGGKTAGALHQPRFQIDHDYYSFGFIRNPWDRMYSVYRRQRVMPKYQSMSFKKYLLELNNEIKASAMWFLDGCDFIGRYENLQSDWRTIQATLGMEPKTLPRLNRCGDADYQNHYDNELIDYVALHHKRDIEYGGYVF